MKNKTKTNKQDKKELALAIKLTKLKGGEI